MQAHAVLGIIAMAKKTPDGATAEKEFRKVSEISPGYASIAYTLGTLIYGNARSSAFPEALFYFARAIEITGPQALNAQGKTAAEAYLKKAYAGYHGDETGLEDVKKAAIDARPSCRPDFKIESVTDIAKKQEGDAAAFAAAHPDIALFRQIRDALKARTRRRLLRQIKDSDVPPDGGPFTMFNAKVVSQPSPNEMLVNVDSLAGDATLKFENAPQRHGRSRHAFKFKGVIDHTRKIPYMLSGLWRKKMWTASRPGLLHAPHPQSARPPRKKRAVNFFPPRSNGTRGVPSGAVCFCRGPLAGRR